MTELKFGIFTIDGVWRELSEGTTNSIWIQCDHVKSIVSMLAIHFGTGWSVQPSRDRVSISPKVLKPRSCVDFAEIVSVSSGVHWSSTHI